MPRVRGACSTVCGGQAARRAAAGWVEPLMPHSEHVFSLRRLALATPRSGAAVEAADGRRSHVSSASRDDLAASIGGLADRAGLA